MKKELLARRDNLARGLVETTENLVNDDTSFSEEADQASAETEKGLLLKMKDRDRDALRQIDIAVTRIEAGTFGVCQSCDDPIADARIRANPLTTLCIQCQAELESEQSRYTGR